MAVRSYELVGRLHSVEEFHKYLYAQMLEDRTLELEAREIGNDFANKRQEATRNLNVVVDQIYHGENSTVNGRDSFTRAFV